MAAAGTAMLALMTATQIYLSMWTHGHSFVRMVAWQMAVVGLLDLSAPRGFCAWPAAAPGFACWCRSASR